MSDPTLDILNASSGAVPVAAGGTITFQYPDGRARATYLAAANAVLGVRSSQALYRQDLDFTYVLGPTSVVVTYLGTIPIAANVTVSLQLTIFDTSGSPVSADAFSIPDPAQNPGL